MTYKPRGYPDPLRIRALMGGYSVKGDPETRDEIMAELRRDYYTAKAYHQVFQALTDMSIAERKQFLSRLRIDLDEADHAAAR